jgi:hypothetical protein
MLTTLLAAGVSLMLQQSAPAPAIGAIAVLVEESDAHAPVPEARVTVHGPGNRQTGDTGSDGRVMIERLVPGLYVITVEMEGFVRGNGMAAVNTTTALATAVTITVQRAGVITGRVLDDHGNPRAGVAVTPLHRSASTFLDPDDGALSPRTNDLGEFRLDGLTAGEYVVLASPQNATGTGTVFMPTYYPATWDKSKATAVAVGSGAITGGVVITMQAMPAWEITGSVVDPSGRPLGRVMISFVTRRIHTDGALRANVNAVMTRPDGTFQITGLGPGTYRLTPTPVTTAAPRMTTGVFTAGMMGNASTVRVDVTDGDVGNVRIVLQPDQ